MAATTVPTQDNILVPETLLKKRKSQERAREERAIATREKRGTLAPCAMDKDEEQAIAMILTTNTSASLRAMLLVVNHLSGMMRSSLVEFMA
jgi:fatty acid/phospholipid biosynthesis enzyme